MKVLIIHNYYSQRGGEETVVEFQNQLFEKNGDQVQLYTRNYAEMKKWWLGKIGGTFTSIYNSRSRRELAQVIEEFKPDMAILHNLYPIISPSIIPFLSKKGVKVVQVLHNYRLFCPIGIFFINNEICHKCLGNGREWNCTLNRCNGGWLASLSYSIRAYFVRKLRYFHKVDHFLALSEFQKRLLSKNGYDASKIKVVPNSYQPKEEFGIEEVDLKQKTEIGFVGRLTIEKGFFDFVEVARRMPQYSFRVAGDPSLIPEDLDIPSNLILEGLLNRDQMVKFYKKCKMILFLSHWYEGFPMVLLESMYYCTPLIVTNLGVMPEVIEHGVTGSVVPVGDIDTIIQEVEKLYNDDNFYMDVIQKARNKIITLYSEDEYYKKVKALIEDKENN